MPIKNVHPTIVADIKKRNSYSDIVEVVKYDSIRFIVLMMDGGKPFTDGQMSQIKTASMVCLRKDGMPVFLAGEVLSGNQIVFDILRQATEKLGTVRAMVQLYDDDGNRVSSLSFSFLVVADYSGENPNLLEHEQTLIEVVLGDGPLAIQQAFKAAEYANLAAEIASGEADRAKAEADYIEGNRPLIEQSITDAADAKTESGQADAKSDFAVAVAETVRGELDDVLSKTGDGNPEIVNARGGFDTLKQRLDDTSDKLADSERQTTVLSTGVTVVNGEVNTPARVEIQGRTLVNLLGKDGNFEDLTKWSHIGTGGDNTSLDKSVKLYGENSLKFNYTDNHGSRYRDVTGLDMNKHYVVIVDGLIPSSTQSDFELSLSALGGSGRFIFSRLQKSLINVWQSVHIKIKGYDAFSVRVGSAVNLTTGIANFDGLRLYEITAEEYAKIGVEWDDEEVASRYPYVDSIQHLQGVGIFAEGDNLFPSFNNPTLKHSLFEILSDYEAKEVITNGTTTDTRYLIKVIRGATYSFAHEGNGTFRIYDGVTVANTPILSNSNGGQFTPTVSEIIIRFYNVNNGVYTYKNPTLTLGSTAKPFAPRNPSYLFADVKLGQIGDKRDLLYKDGERWMLRKVVEKDVVLDGSLGFVEVLNKPDYKAFYTKSVTPTIVNSGGVIGLLVSGEGESVTYDLLRNTPTMKPDTFFFSSQAILFIAVRNVATGFIESKTPTANDIKRYFNGWEYTDGTTWTSVTGNGQAATAQEALDTKPTDYTPYKLSYVRATPEIIDVTDKVEGAVTISGLTQIVVDSGYRRTVVDGVSTWTKGSKYDYTVSPTNFSLTYARNMRGALDDAVGVLENNTTMLSVHEKAIVDLYIRFKALEGTS